MSAANRGAVRHPSDFYPTPAWCVHRLLDAIGADLPPGVWLEPCVGEGAIVNAVQGRSGLTSYYSDIVSPRWRACEVDPEIASRASVPCEVDVGRFQDWGEFGDVALTNPPFSEAEQYVEWSLVHARVSVALLRLNWLGSASRAPLLRAHRPSVYVLPNRPSFTGSGTDSTEYAWFVWGLHDRPTIEVLAVTPKDVRRAAREAVAC